MCACSCANNQPWRNAHAPESWAAFGNRRLVDFSPCPKSGLTLETASSRKTARAARLPVPGTTRWPLGTVRARVHAKVSCVLSPGIGVLLHGLSTHPAYAGPTCDMVPYRSEVGSHVATCMVPVSPSPPNSRPCPCAQSGMPPVEYGAADWEAQVIPSTCDEAKAVAIC